MIYLDTSCLVKLYYPEPESARVAALVQGKPVCHNSLHELEFRNALQLKVFAGTATAAQASAAFAMVTADLGAGVLVSPGIDWTAVFAEAVKLADRHTGTIGCRSLDILHCAVAGILNATEFVTNDARQKRLAVTMGLNLVTL